MSKSLLSAFDIEIKTNKNISNLSDYEIFKDKELLDELRKKIIVNLSNRDISDGNIRDFINKEIDDLLLGYDLSNLERSHLFNIVDNEINGFGPLTSVLDDEFVDEIMVNSADNVYVSIDGKISLDKTISFINDDHILRTLEKILRSIGKNIDYSNPTIEERLNDGSRLNAILPPLSKNPVIVIHKVNRTFNNIDDFIRKGSCTPYMARYLEAAVKAKLNIIISGSKLSGKTTLLNILGDFINRDERVVLIENDQELEIENNNVVSLLNDNSISNSLLIDKSLSLRPDRIIVGELKGLDVYDYLQTLKVGYEGSLTTIYANSADNALDKITGMLTMNENITNKIGISYMVDAIDVIVHIERLKDGKKKITNISELIKDKSGNHVLVPIFLFNENGVLENGEINGEYELLEGSFESVNKIINRGITDIEDIFDFMPKIK